MLIPADSAATTTPTSQALSLTAPAENGRDPGSRSGGSSPLGLSLRLVRELLAADRSADQRGEDLPARSARLLGATLGALRLAVGAILHRDPGDGRPSLLASSNWPEGAAELSTDLPGAPGGLQALAARALEEHRIFVVGSSEKGLFSSVLSDTVHASWAVIPLFDQGAPVGALLVALRRGGLVKSTSMRALAPGFHLLGVLLSAGRARNAPSAERAPEATDADHERHSLEMQEMAVRLRDAEEAVRLAEERESSKGAQLRSEIESNKTRIAELEAGVAQRAMELNRRLSEDEVRARIESACADRDRRIAELGAELEAARTEAVAGGERSPLGAKPRGQHVGSPAWESETGEDDSGEAFVTAAEEEGSLADLAGEAAAALAAESEAVDGETAAGEGGDREDGPELGDEAIDRLAAEEIGLERLAILLVDSDPAMHALMSGVATGAGASFWAGQGDAPQAVASLLVINLFADRLGDAAEVAATVSGGVRTVAYCSDPERGSSLMIGPAEILRRPIDPLRAVEQLRRSVPGKLERVVIVSSQLRELSALRERLSAGGTSSSVACDVRQAIEVLDIIKRPDAFVIDLALEGGGGLLLTEHLRSRPDMERVPVALLLPAEIDPHRMRLEAPSIGRETAEVLVELRRLVASTAAALDSSARS
ncbi:MAG TPA: hypothetical protein VEI94_12955 [Candidatus Bathyarchaeia archaeon]|nr:hypothetical protein [Candidatus Bathyarchaeia archaeon]